MSKGRGRQKVDRKAAAAANGYVRGANREHDQERCEIIYSDESIALQERVISDYVSWASEENQSLRDGGLQKGHPVPDLATIKDFVRFYISSTNGILSLRPTKSSVLNFAERFFAGFTRITKSIFDKKDTQDVFTFIKKRLVKEEKLIEDIRRAKHMLTHCDLTNILVSLWNDDDPLFIHPRYRVQMTFTIQIYCYSGARIGTFIPDTSKADERGLRYQDIELYIYRRPDGEIELFFRLSEKWVKNNDNPKNTVFRLAMREHRKLRFNPVAFLLVMAFQDGAFLHVDSMESLKRWNPDHNDPVPLLWKPSVAEEPVLRTVTRAGGVSKRPWTRESFCKIFRAVVTNAGYPEIITIHTLRRGLANMLDKVATEAERSQVLTQKDPNVFGRSYIDSTSALSTMDAFLGEKMRLDHIEYLRGVGKYRALGYPRHLPAERQHAIRQNETLQGLERRLQELQKIPHTCTNTDNGHGEHDNDAADSGDEDTEFAIKLTKKQLQVLRTRLYNTELAKYRDEWIQDRLETQVKSGGKASDVIVYNDITQCLFKAQPERQRVAELMPSDKSFSYQDMLSAVENLLIYCTKNYDVFYRPGEEPLNGRCPVGGCDLDHLTRPKRSNHVQDCRLQGRCEASGYKSTQLKYCYECFDFLTTTEWEDHCNNHLQHDISRRCEIITYCYTLVRPGYCPFCLGCDRVAPSQRMNVWKRSNELRAHVNEHIKRISGNYFCSHPICQAKFDSEMQLRYHLSDIHGMHKAIWDQVGGPVKPSKKKDLDYQVNSPVGAAKRKGQALVGQRESKRQYVSYEQAEDFQIIMWEYPDPPNNPTVACDVPIPADDKPSSPSASPSELVIELGLWERPVKTATEDSLVRLCATGPTVSSTSDENGVARTEHISDYNGCPPCISNWPSPPGLTTSIEFKSSTTSTTPELPPIDPQILLGDKDRQVGLSKDEFELRKMKEGGVLRFRGSSSVTENSPTADILRADKLWLAEERDLSIDTQTDLVEINSILETPIMKMQQKNPQTLSAPDSVQSSRTVDPLSGSENPAPGGAGPITRARKRAAQSQDHIASHKSSRVTRSSSVRRNTGSLKI
ncbi:uncharacterized protein BDV14DRAFT_186161 [Aspergillus stella-maris]|uniref:uncharacterized protein n=1 Tax=Aspergillus stella-maris TaxID=1810926 RepID=UPI003CCE45E4